MMTRRPSELTPSQAACRTMYWIVLAFGAVLAFGVALGVIVDLAAAGSGATGLDTQVLHWIADGRTSTATEVMRRVTALGSSAVIMPLTIVFATALSLVRRSRLALYLVVVVLGASLLSALTKSIVGRPRPPVSARLAGVGDSAFPSGHTLQATATYAALAVVVGVVTSRAGALVVAWLCAGLVIVLVGCSRLYLGVHWLTDVLAGWALGTAWVGCVTLAFEPWFARDRSCSQRRAPGRPPVDPQHQRDPHVCRRETRRVA